jgi:hypothetical protein
MSEQAQTEARSQQYSLPSAQCMNHSVKLAIAEDRPIMLDYYTDSLDGKVIIGVREDGEEKLLVKSEEEYTSAIAKIYKVGEEYIILTENSLYIVSSKVESKRIA